MDKLLDQLDNFRKSALYSAEPTTNEIEFISSRIISFYLGFTASIFFILIIYAGIMWMTAEGNEDKVAKAQKLILHSTIALAVIFFSYLIAVVVSIFLQEDTQFQTAS